jgi:hypothetical protein
MNKDDNIEGGKEKLTQEYEEAQNELKELVKLENDYLDYVKKESILLDKLNNRYRSPDKDYSTDDLLAQQNIVKKQLELDRSELEEQIKRIESQLEEYKENNDCEE